MKRPLVHAHRGASAYAPENTMAAFELALAMKADAIELDIQLTSDDKIVVIHDFSVDRTSNGKGMVKDMSIKELRELDFGSWKGAEFKGEKIPLLEQVMQLILNTEVILNIEIKANSESNKKELEKKTVELIKTFALEDRVIVSSFNHYSLAEIKLIEPRIKTGILYSEQIFKPWEYAKTLNADTIHPNYKSLIPEIIDNCKKNNIIVNAWTIDAPEVIKLLVTLGVDGIITNVPDITLKIIEEMKL